MTQSKELNPTWLQSIKARVKRIVQLLRSPHKHASLPLNVDELNFRSIIDTYPGPIVYLDVNGRIKYINPTILKELGCKIENIIGKTVLEIKPTIPMLCDTRKIYDSVLKVVSTKKSYLYQEWATNEYGRICYEIGHFPEFNQKGELIGIVGLTKDITTQARMSDLAKFLAKVDTSSKHCFYTKVVKYVAHLLGMEYVFIQTLNKVSNKLELKAAYGLINKLMISYPFKNSLCEKSLTSDTLGYATGISRKNPHDILLAQLNAECGASIPMFSANNTLLGFLTLLTKKQMPEAKGKAMKELVHIVSRRLTSALENEHLMDAKAAREEDYRVLVESSPDYISRFNAQGEMVYLNPALESIGFDLNDVTPENTTLESKQKFSERVNSVLKTGKDSQFIDEIVIGHNKKINYMDVRIVAQRNQTGKIIGALVVGRNITKRVILEDELRKQASIDSLTGLPNRRLFFDSLDLEIAKAKRENNKIAILFIDLDRFKEINDTLGHDAGDTLLKDSALRIKNTMRESDMVARFGGDEFVVLLSPIERPVDVINIAESIINLLGEPYDFDGTLAYVSASIGIAIYPSDTDNASDLITYADQAMYSAKKLGRSTFRFFTPAMQIESNIRVSMANDLRVALTKNQLKVFYQPIIDLNSNKVIKAEALLRWVHPERGTVYPDKFIPLAEDTGLINEIGDWVFKQAIAMAAVWQSQVDHKIQVNINISPRQFNQENIVESWLTWLAEVNLPPQCVTLELTESLLLDEQDGLKQKLSHLHKSGIELALDDFGTGYSAMAYLKKFNIDYLKIDGSFIRDMTFDESDRAITETIILMASKLGMKSVAECVETIEQEHLLKQLNCDYLQGNLYTKPLLKSEFINYVNLMKNKESLT